MKKFLVFLFLFSITLSGIFAKDDIFFRNPGDSKVFHSNGLPFKSETRANSDGVVPKTELIVGDAVQTLGRNADIKIVDFTVELKKNSLMSIQRVTDSKIIVYLLDGSLNAHSPDGTSLNSKEFIIITPVSRFSATVPFNVDVSSISTTESIYVNKGSVLAHNFLTKENVALQETESIDFLKSRNKIVSVDSTRLTEEGAYDALGIKPNTYSSSSSSTTTTTSTSSPESSDSKRVLSIKLTVGKDGAYISPYSGRMLNVPRDSNAYSTTTTTEDNSSYSQTNSPRVPSKPSFTSSNEPDYSNINIVNSTPTQSSKPTSQDINKTPAKAETTKKPTGSIGNENLDWRKPVDDTKKETTKKDVAKKEPINNTKKEVTNKESEQLDAKKLGKLPVKENTSKIVSKADEKKPEKLGDESLKAEKAKNSEPAKKQQPIKKQEKKEVAKKKLAPRKKSSRPFGMGVDLGISSVFDWDTAKNGDAPKLRLIGSPYMRSSNMDIKFNLLVDYEQDANNKFKFSLPQLDYFKNNGLKGLQKVISPITQFVDDFVLGNWFFISRNYDLPIEYNSSNLNKFSALDNEYRTYSYSSGNKVYTDQTMSKKLPFLLSIDTKHILIRAFTQDIENLFRFNPENTEFWKRDDASVTAVDLGFDTKHFGMVVGGIYTRGAYDSTNSKGTDKILATARINLNLNEKINLAINGYIPLFDFVTTYSNGTGKSSMANFLGDFPKRFAAGASFNIQAKKVIFNVGADFNLGQLYTGIINRRSVFAENGQNLYVEGINNAFAVYPYINMDFKFGAMALNLNADIPVFIGGSQFTLTHLKSWSNMDFFYRINGGATLKFNFANVMQLSAKLTADNLFPLRAASLASTDFKTYAKDTFSIWNVIPKLSFQIVDGPIFLKVTAEQRNVDNNGAIVKKFNPGFTFESRVSLGTDYLLNPNYIRERKYDERKKESAFNLIFNTDIGFYSARYSNADYTAFSITPHVGVKHKIFTVIAKFEIENFKLPNIFSSPIDIGEVVSSLIDEINFLNIVKIKETDAMFANRRSTFASDQYIKTLQTDISLPGILDINIADTASFINGLLNSNQSTGYATYADISIGWIAKQKFFLNNIVEFAWNKTAGTFDATDKISFNLDLSLNKFFFGLDLGTEIAIDKTGNDLKFTTGFNGGFKDWKYVAALGFGYTNPEKFALKAKVGVQSGGLAYNMYDYMATNTNGSFSNTYLPTDSSGNQIVAMTEFADVDLLIRLSNTLSLQTGYYLPLAMFGDTGTSEKLLRDRISAKLTFNTPIFDVFAVAEKRGMFFAGTGWFADVDNFALKGGLEFKADYATFKTELESAHFIYEPGNAANQTKDFSVNVEVKFGLY